MTTKSELRAQIVAARRFHDAAIRTLDARWKVLLAETANLPPAERNDAVARAADDLAPYLGAPAEPENDPRGFVRRRMRGNG